MSPLRRIQDEIDKLCFVQARSNPLSRAIDAQIDQIAAAADGTSQGGACIDFTHIVLKLPEQVRSFSRVS